MSTARDLKNIFAEARPLVEQWLDIGEQIAALREAATAKGLDWSQVKSLVKAQVQDERDGSGEGKRVKRIVEKAEFASAYADMLGLAKMNENNFSAEISVGHGDGRGLDTAERREEEGMPSAAEVPGGRSDAAVPEGQGQTAATLSTSRPTSKGLAGGSNGKASADPVGETARASAHTICGPISTAPATIPSDPESNEIEHDPDPVSEVEHSAPDAGEINGHDDYPEIPKFLDRRASQVSPP